MEKLQTLKNLVRMYGRKKTFTRKSLWLEDGVGFVNWTHVTKDTYH